MKASELRIGNLVHYPGQILPVTAIDSDRVLDGELRCSIRLGGIMAVWLHQISPIPLTEEWLFKCGFAINEHNENEYVLNKGGFKLLRYENAFVFKVCDQIVCYMPIQYVHRLQNIHHSLTLQELTFNEMP